jgi:pyrimidine-specific ribonucleoside hydrolase
MPIPLILDVDTGVDDAFALMLAARHPDADLRAVTCVAGNAPVDQVVANTLQVLDAAGAAHTRQVVSPGRSAGSPPRQRVPPGVEARNASKGTARLGRSGGEERRNRVPRRTKP